MSSAFLLGSAEGAEVTALGSTYVTKTDGSQVEGAYSLMEESFWADSTPLHTHVAAEEAFYVLSGEVEAWVAGSVDTAGPGSFLVVPRAEVVRQGEDELLADPERLAALAARFGTEVLGDYPG